jgi:hypothetical protein
MEVNSMTGLMLLAIVILLAGIILFKKFRGLKDYIDTVITLLMKALKRATDLTPF